MSYDIRLGVKIDGLDQYAVIGEPDISDPTYNLGDMFRACTGWDYKQGTYYKCSEVISLIERGIRELTVNPSGYTQYVPPSGWGTMRNAKETLMSMRECIYNFAEDIPIDHLWIRW